MEENKVIWPGWEVVRQIGSGSFGNVYEIQRTIRGRTEHAAVKMLTIPQNKSEIAELRADGYDDESITQYFADSLDKIESEYAMMADMKGHSNVVYCDDIRSEPHADGFGWDIYIKMELLTSAKSVLREDAVQEQAVRLGLDMCGALELCEKLNIVHRDIKPENIFVSRDGTYKLGDFGIARTMEGTTGGTKTGTYDYMAPEVYNNRPYHNQADIYSLGLVLYWMLNERTVPFLPIGTRPTPSIKSMARERRFSGEPIPAPVNGSDALKAIVLKACAFDPKERYASAAEMREDLRKLDTGAAFVPPVVPAAAAEPGEGTVNIFTGRQEKSAEPVEGTVNLFGGQMTEEKTEYIKEEKTEYIRDEKTEYIPRTPETPKENPKKKKLWLFPVIAIILVIAILLAALRSCGGEPADSGVDSTACPHTFGYGACEDPVICTDCGEQLREAPGHDWISVRENKFTLVSFRQILLMFESENGDGQYSDQEKMEAKQRAESIIQEFWADPTEGTFAALAAQYSEDAAAKENGGLYSNVYQGQMCTNVMNDWCFDENREPGDWGLLEIEHGYVIVYLVNTDVYCIDNTEPQYCAQCHKANGDIVVWEEVVPPTTAPEQTVPPTTVPEQTVPPTTAPEQTEPTTVPHVHNWTAATCTEPKMCASCGITEGSAAGHKWTAATYTAPKTCSVCKLTEGEPMGKIVSISTAPSRTIAVKYDGTAEVLGYPYVGPHSMSDWTDIVSVSAGPDHAVGLKSDGTVVAVGMNGDGQCDVSEWTDIISVSAGLLHTVGLKSDGTVVATGSNAHGQCDVSGWKDIISISAGSLHTVGLRSDGTVVAVGNSRDGQCAVTNWKNIVSISAAGFNTVGLQADGTVVGRGHIVLVGRFDVSDWKDIISISTSSTHTVGLKSDGTVVAVGSNDQKECEVSGWKDIVFISATGNHTVGIKADGTIVAVGANSYGQCDVSVWNK